MEFEKFTPLVPTSRKVKGRVCSVANCNSTDDGTVTFHQFPKYGKKIVVKNPNGTIFYCDRRKVWEDLVGVDQKVTYQSKVCSLHFSPEDFRNYDVKKHRRLKVTAIPNLNLPEDNLTFSGFKNVPKALCEFNGVDCNRNLKRKAIQPGRQICDNDSAIKERKLEESPDLVTKFVDLTQPESSQCETKSAIYNSEIFDLLLMHTSFEVENLTGNLNALNYNSSHT